MLLSAKTQVAGGRRGKACLGPSGAVFGGGKGTNGMGRISSPGVLRLRARSTVSRDESVRRFAQDDDFVGVSTKNILNELALMGQRPGPRSGVPGDPPSGCYENFLTGKLLHGGAGESP